MKKHFLKFSKVLTNIAFSPLILISNNSELAAKYLQKNVDQSFTDLDLKSFKKVFFKSQISNWNRIYLL